MALKVSRQDIEVDKITDFPLAERFIKFDLNKYFSLLDDFKPLRPQYAFINAVNNPQYRFVCAALSRRTGKTHIANIIAQLTVLVPGNNVLIMSPNYNLSEISFRQQRQLLKKFGIEVEKDNAKDRIIELVNGSTIRMGSISMVDACIGRSYNLILFDEAAIASEAEEGFNTALRPTLDRPGSKAVFISTPRGKNNWFSKFYDRGYSDEFPQWVSIWSDFRENDRMGVDDVEEARKTMSKSLFAQEYEASFESFEGQIFSFDSDKCKIEELPSGSFEVIAGVDFGFKDPTAIIVIGLFEGNYYVMDEYLAASKVTREHAEKMQELSVKHNVEVIFGDSAAAQTIYDWSSEYDLPIMGAKKSVLDGIAYVQNIVDSGRLLVLSHCTNTIQMLDQYAWDDKATILKERPKHDNYSHMADALRYALYSYAVNMGEVVGGEISAPMA